VVDVIENLDDLFKYISHGVYVIGVSDGEHQRPLGYAGFF
jgi:hypothetical protein